MHFEPLSFTLEPGQRSVRTQLQGKKIALSDTRVTLRGAMREQGMTLDLPTFTLEPYGDGYELSWDEDLSETTTVLLEARGAGGQFVGAHLVLHVPTVAPAPTNAEALNNVRILIAAGIPAEAAVEKVVAKFGEESRTQILEGLMGELS